MNKLIVVTGGTKGIGRAIVKKFAGHGFDIITCARNGQDLTALKEELENAYTGIHVHTFRADIAVKKDVTSFGSFVRGLNRPVTVLVNNAGFFLPGEICSEPEGTLESMIAGNLYSAYYTTRELAAGMKEERAGHIFNMCSIASIKAYPNGGSYAISKFALLGFSKCLREELKPFNIRVTAVMPGATLTASWAGTDWPDERFMKAEDVADMVFQAHSISHRSVVEEIIIRPPLGDL
jgi:short-subunit dehydrogenase